MEHLSFNPRNLIVFALSITVIAFSICYDMSIRENWMKPPEFFLSGAINYMPASSIGAFGLILGIACIPPVMLVRYVQVEESAPGLRVNKISLYSSWIASFGAFIVACFQARSNIHVHLFGAGVFFTFSLFVVLSQIYIDRVTKDRIPHGIGTNLRLGIAFISVGSLVTLAIQGLMVLVEYKGDVSKGTPEGLKLPMSVMELTFFATCLVVYASMIPDFGDRRLRLTVVKLSDEELDEGEAMKPIV
ncbi:hypothetical protein TrLO_g8551 [Triparma laevis f. longispina]|uniref:CWH43-like N-terminal domain-containing protein n=1 Tax=Triparma laevis f. longispina TaxID=1714387 RepID=A0A9W7FJG3_9STRA|nr:hypothetical protein TrLO_g8551 [Triparma laevis f. longispina]